MLIYSSHPPAALPAEFRAWLDPSVPLPGQVVYLKMHIDDMHLVLLKWFLTIPAAVAVAKTASDLVNGCFVMEQWMICFPLFTLPFVIAWWAGRRHRRLQRDIAGDRIRMGLFLHPDVLLLRSTRERCSLIPCRFIVSFQKVIDTIGKHYITYSIRINYRVTDKGGGERIKYVLIRCSQLEGYYHREEQLLEELNLLLAPRGNGSGAGRSKGHTREHKQPSAASVSVSPSVPLKKYFPRQGRNTGTTRWECSDADGRNYLCEVRKNEVVWRENWHNYLASETCGSVSHAVFMRGEYQALIRRHFGEQVLRDVIASVLYYSPHLSTKY